MTETTERNASSLSLSVLSVRSVLSVFFEVGMPRDKITLECTECKSRNFFTDKNKRKHPERVERRKYCPRCDTHRAHKESK